MNRNGLEKPSGMRNKKEQLVSLLADRNFEKLDRWIRAERNPFRLLTSLLFDEDREIVWRSLEAIGRVADIYSQKKKNSEKIRRQLQRYFWMMNDESGALCWFGPEAVAEILANAEPLQEDFAMILPSFLIEEPFEAGTRWGMARIVDKSKLPEKIMKHYLSFESIITETLNHDDPNTRGKGIILMNALKIELPCDLRGELEKDSADIELYDYETGRLVLRKISDLIQ